MSKTKHPKIVIVGRPNVGKSSLFNRIAGRRKAIVESISGTTRDRIYADIAWKGKAFKIVDTGGFEEHKQGDMAKMVLKQLHSGIEEADILFFVTDASEGIMPVDIDLAGRLRKTAKRIFIIANKVDSPHLASKAMEFFELGLGEPYCVSANNGTGIDKLLDDLVRYVDTPELQDKIVPVNVAIVGRPNVGKSSYVNALLGAERVIVHSVAGTTRDSVDTDFVYRDRNFCLVDTAGMRHNMKIDESVDFFSTVRSREAIKRADAILVIIDGFDGLREDDVRIVEFAIKEGKPLVVAVNKWDLTKSVQMADYTKLLMAKMPALYSYPVIFISCKTKRNITSSLDLIWAGYEKSRKVFGPDELKEVLKKVNRLPEVIRKRLEFSGLYQVAAQPPTFNIKIWKDANLTANMKKYVEKFVRTACGLEGVPVKFTYNK